MIEQLQFNKMLLQITRLHMLILITILQVSYGCGPGRGGIRRRGSRKLTPLVYKQHVPNFSEKSLAASGLSKEPVSRTSAMFRRLVPNYNPDVLFKDEEGTGADRLMTQRCKEKLNTLAISVMNQWPGVHLRVIEGWDEERHHSRESLHYEGRALDLTTSDRDRRKYGLLARLAVESGFDWVYFESRSHIHASCKHEITDPSKQKGGCFTGSSQVMLEGGKKSSLKSLKIGDMVLTSNSDGDLEYSPVILFLHKNAEEERLFLVLTTENGHRITLTPDHLIYTQQTGNNNNKFETTFAKNVQINDRVLTLEKGKLVDVRISEISVKVTEGIYAPLTANGNIVIDGVLTSCYATIKSQTIAHAAFLPVRIYEYLKNTIPVTTSELRTNDIEEEYDIHPYAMLLYDISKYIFPNLLL